MIEQEARSNALYRERYRPQFHFTAAKNWLNDPNGLVFYNGEYHLFFQHNPSGIKWGNMTWGHAVSGDLVHWEQLEHALHPDELGTMFSGSAVVDWNNTAGLQKGDERTIVCIYTAAGEPYTQCIAHSTDSGRTFVKYDENPVLPHIAGANRDPKVIWHQPTSQWIMALYLDGETFALFSSADLKSWQQLQDLVMPGCDECPDFFPIALDDDASSEQWIFTAANGNYLVGDFDGKEFTFDTDPLPSDRGANFYAVQTWSDIPESDGRRIQIGWMRGGSYPEMPFNQQMTFPCELRLRSFAVGPRLCRYPVREIEGLHGEKKTFTDTPLAPGENLLSGMTGGLLDIDIDIDVREAAEIGFVLCGGMVRYSVTGEELTVLDRSVAMAPEGGRIQLRILLDRTSLEVFGNDGMVSMSSCFLPVEKDSSVRIYAKGGSASIRSMEVREVMSSWTGS